MRRTGTFSHWNVQFCAVNLNKEEIIWTEIVTERNPILAFLETPKVCLCQFWIVVSLWHLKIIVLKVLMLHCSYFQAFFFLFLSVFLFIFKYSLFFIFKYFKYSTQLVTVTSNSRQVARRWLPSQSGLVHHRKVYDTLSSDSESHCCFFSPLLTCPAPL